LPGLQLRLDKLAWGRPGHRRCLKPDILTIDGGEATVALAADAADAEGFADVVLGQAWPLRGRIHIAEREITWLPAGERSVAFVPAGGGLLPHLTVAQNIGYGVPRRHGGDYLHSQVTYVADRLDLRALLGWRPYEISAHERLRVALARAMCHRPGAQAVLIEDLAGHLPCHPAVSECLRAYPDLPILIVSDDLQRVETLRPPSVLWKVVDADAA
jgi:ABC-type thiamine transport system ATPase subunit